MPRLMPLWIALALLIPASMRSAEPTPPTPTKADPRELVVGDYYHGTIKRQQVTSELDGHLVHFTDDWLVLGVIRCEGRVRGLPWLSEMPYIGAAFRKSTTLVTKSFFWVPRTAVTLTSHESFPNQAGFEDFRDDKPKLEADCEICLASGETALSDGGQLVGITGNTLNLTTHETESRVKESRWSGLPVVGGMFLTEYTVTRKVDKQVPLDDVLYIWQRSLYDLDKQKAKSDAK